MNPKPCIRFLGECLDSCFRILAHPQVPVKAVMIVLFCLVSVKDISREPSNLRGIPIDHSFFLRGTLYREEKTPVIISRILQEDKLDNGLMVQEIVEFIKAHPVNLESKWRFWVWH